MTPRTGMILLAALLSMGCKLQTSEDSTDTDGSTDPSTELPPTRVDLQDERPIAVALWTWLPEQSGEAWCRDLQPSDFTEVVDRDEQAVDCWIGTGSNCHQYLTFHEDGTLAHQAVFVVQLPCGSEQPETTWIGGWYPERHYEYQGHQDTRDRYAIDGQEWLMEYKDHNIWVDVGEHTFLLQP